MFPTTLSRRHLLGAGAAAAALVATEPGHAVAGDAPPPDPDDPRRSIQAVGTLTRSEVFGPIGPGEQVHLYAAASLTPNGLSGGTTNASGGPRGAAPVGAPGTFNYLSTSVDLAVGSTIKSIEFVIEGNPQAGRVALLRWTIDITGTPVVYLYNMTIPGGTNGISIYSQVLNEVVDGTHTYEAFYTDNGTALTGSFCNGIRVRYLPPPMAPPPQTGLVPISPARAYDSRLPMTPDASGSILTNTSRTISVANARDVTTGAVTGALVPANATSVVYTLTVANTAGQGFLAVNPGGTATVSASSINWFGNGQLLANTGIVKLGADRTLTVVAGGGGTTDFIVDIVGYFI